MKALLAGYGGIGKNVYYPELKKLGYDVFLLDPAIDNADYSDVSSITDSFDLAVVSTPNFTHELIANHLAAKGTKRIFVEKPGVVNTDAWVKLNKAHPVTQFHLVKNNLYRESYGEVLSLAKEKELIGVDILWYNKNRIPNPGSWFTTSKLAFGGVSHDLMPHIYCFAAKIFGIETILSTHIDKMSYQRWALENISNTDYGTVTPNGIFDVGDTAMATAIIDGVTVKMAASWKEGYDKQSITLFFRDGSTYEWEFGLCPAEAYGIMLQDTLPSYYLDIDIHLFLEGFNGN
jgi:predicted dehydrogenase